MSDNVDDERAIMVVCDNFDEALNEVSRTSVFVSDYLTRLNVAARNVRWLVYALRHAGKQLFNQRNAARQERDQAILQRDQAKNLFTEELSLKRAAERRLLAVEAERDALLARALAAEAGRDALLARALAAEAGRDALMNDEMFSLFNMDA